MRKTVRRASLVLALTPLVSLPTAALAAGTGGGLLGGGLTSGGSTRITTPAPDGDASAVAAEVSGIVAIGKTHAHAGSGGGTAAADAVDLLGQRVSGGDQSGVGSKSGNLLGTGDTPLGDAEVAPWTATVADKNGGYQSHAEAALAHARLAKLVELWVLHSASDATWTPDQSTGDATSDGAEVDVADQLDVKVLHSEAHSTGKSHSAILSINGNEILTSDDAGGSCEIDASPLLDLLCLTASGGSGAGGVTDSASSVATFTLGGGALTGTISGATSQGGSAPEATPAAPKARHHHIAGGAGNGNGSAAGAGAVPVAAPEASALPFTGDQTGRWAAIGAALVALGGAMTAYGRRWRHGLRAC